MVRGAVVVVSETICPVVHSTPSLRFLLPDCCTSVPMLRSSKPHRSSYGGILGRIIVSHVRLHGRVNSSADTHLAFFDQHIKGLRSEAASWPPVRYFLMGLGSQQLAAVGLPPANPVPGGGGDPRLLDYGG